MPVPIRLSFYHDPEGRRILLCNNPEPCRTKADLSMCLRKYAHMCIHSMKSGSEEPPAIFFAPLSLPPVFLDIQSLPIL